MGNILNGFKVVIYLYCFQLAIAPQTLPKSHYSLNGHLTLNGGDIIWEISNAQDVVLS